MPYQVFEEDGKWCTYTIDENGNKVGKPHGTFDTKVEARAQMRALYANMMKSLPDTVGPELQTAMRDAAELMVVGDGLVEPEELVEEDLSLFAPEEVDLPEILQKAMQVLGGKRVDRDKLPRSRFVFPDERTFPIVTAKSVMDAVHRWGSYKGKHSFEEFKRRLIALAKRLGFASNLPEKWVQKSEEVDSSILHTLAKSLYDSRSDRVWVGVSHNAWKDNLTDIIPLELILDDIEWQKSRIASGETNQFGEGLWVDHKSKSVEGDCLVREVIEGGRSCIEGGRLLPNANSPNSAKMSIGYKALMLGSDYLLVYVFERSRLERTKAINDRTFFSVKHGNLVHDSMLKSITDDLSAHLGG